MVKKTIFGIALFALAAILVGGAILHTLDKTGQADGSQERGRNTQESRDSREAGGQRYGQHQELPVGAAADTSEAAIDPEEAVTPVDEEAATSALTAGEEPGVEAYSWAFA
jgi:hypothetical protein